MWLRNIKLKWDKSAPRRAASNPQLISPVVAPHHCAPLPLFSMTMCQIWAFWKHFPYAIIGSLLSRRKDRNRREDREKKKNTRNVLYQRYRHHAALLFFFLFTGSLKLFFFFFEDFNEVRGKFDFFSYMCLKKKNNDCIFMERFFAWVFSAACDRVCEFQEHKEGKDFHRVSLFYCLFIWLIKAVVFWTLHAGAFCLQSDPLLDANFAGIRDIIPFIQIYWQSIDFARTHLNRAGLWI